MAHQVPTLSGLLQSDTTSLSDSIPERDGSADIYANVFRGSGGLRSAGHLYLDTSSKTTSFTVDESTHNSTHYLVSTAGGAVTVTLPAATGVTDKVVIVTKTTSDSSNVVIDANSTETADGTLTVVLYRQYDHAILHCDGTGWHVIQRPATLFCSVAASTAVTASSETDFDQSVTLGANTLKAGDRIKFRAQVFVTAADASDTLTVRAKIGSTTIASTGALDATANDVAYIEGEVVIRTSGASGTLVASGVAMIGVEGTATAKPFKLASTAIDTTAAQAFKCTGQWSDATGNSCRLDTFTVERA
jgi:hypothetical protein